MGSLTAQGPPLNGSISVLPGLVDYRADNSPQDPWVVFPSREDSTKSTSISFLEVSFATHKIAHALRPDRSGPEQEVVAMLLNCDTVLYIAAMAAMFRAGMVPFPMSPKNSPEAVCHMLKTTGCHRIITQASMSPLTSAVRTTLEKEGFHIQLSDLPALQDVFPSLNPVTDDVIPTFTLYPPPKTQRQPDDLAIYIHSSGSTGLPKSIPWTERIFRQWADNYVIRMCSQHRLLWGCMAVPTFHGIGITAQVLTPFVTGFPVALFTPLAPAPPVLPNPKNMIDVAIATGCNAMVSVPVFIEMWCRSAETIQYLASLEILVWSGGPLSAGLGDMLVSAGVNLTSVYGITETGVLNKIMDVDFSPEPRPGYKTPREWAWLQFDERINIRWAPQGDGTFELQVLNCDSHVVAVENLPDVRGYATGDVFVQSRNRPGLWRISGRADDVIVLRSGEKVVPLQQEDFLNAVSIVSSAIMFGRGQSQPGIIIELTPECAIDPNDESALIAMRNTVWPFVEEANKLAPTFARLFKETILVADPSRPFARTPKGTPIRKAVVKAYDAEIKELYQLIEDNADAKGVIPPAEWTLQEVELWLAQHAAGINKGLVPSSSIDLFEQGFDSLSVTFLRNRIIAGLHNSEDKAKQAAAREITQEFVFQHPTLSRLAIAVIALVIPDFKHATVLSPTEEITAMIAKYSADLPSFKEYRAPSSGAVVLLTGSTGALGSHILNSLLSTSLVIEVITLNRSGNVAERQQAAFEERGIPTELLSSPKLTSVIGDMKQRGLGLNEIQLREIRQRVTHVIHNAWRVDFNLSLSSFEAYVANVRNLIDFSASCENPIRFLFTSSAAAVYSWDVNKGSVPEEVFEDPGVAAASGYGQAKYVVENILARAARHGMSAITTRIGQVCGSTTAGDWNTSEWLPILLKTSLAIDNIPEITGPISWVPIDIAAHSVVDVFLTPGPVPELVNIVHPRPVILHDIFEALNRIVNDRLEVVPLDQWIEQVEGLSSNVSSRDVEAYPAVKLLRFWKEVSERNTNNPGYEEATVEAAGLPVLQTTKAESLSPSLRAALPLGESQAELWLQYWQKISFITL